MRGEPFGHLIALVVDGKKVPRAARRDDDRCAVGLVCRVDEQAGVRHVADAQHPGVRLKFLFGLVPAFRTRRAIGPQRDDSV